MYWKKTGWLLLAASVALTPAKLAWASKTEEIDQLLDMSLEGLMDIEVTSVSKKKEKASEAPAAVYVITQQDIKRAGATSVPELLRMVPGMQVARLDSHKWAITARGFNGQFANKLLVLIDGRTIYTPLFSGVFWDEKTLPLDDIDRIEVIRGPGATLWGANAVNGVINIMTKHAKDSQGGHVTAGGGNYEHGFGSMRYGGKSGDAFYRISANYTNRGETDTTAGNNNGDDWDVLSGGFRVDWEKQKDSLTVQGDIYNGSEGQAYTLPTVTPPYSRAYSEDTDFHGGNILTRWQRTFSETSDATLQLYYDNAARDYFVLDHKVETFDLDFQHAFAAGARHEIVWGAGYRYIRDEIESTPYLSMSSFSDQGTDDIFSSFLQDKITLKPDTLFLTLGSKFELNGYSGFEVQPSARLSWNVSEGQTLWSSVSRAVRTPSRGLNATLIPITLPPSSLGAGTPAALVQWYSINNPGSEKLWAYEIGYKAEPAENVSFDATAFYNVYDDLIFRAMGTPSLAFAPVPHLVLPFAFSNSAEGDTYGIELAARWQVNDRWQLAGGYSYMEAHLTPKMAAASNMTQEHEENFPKHQFNLRSYFDLTDTVSLDSAIYYVDDLPAYGVRDYLRLDLRLAWQPRENLELSITGQNLLDDHHQEFQGSLFSQQTEIGRSFYGKVAWSF